MTLAPVARSVIGNLGRFLEHAAAVVIGLALMVLGLGLGVTMIMLPAGIVIGLIGVLILVGGLFVRFDES